MEGSALLSWESPQIPGSSHTPGPASGMDLLFPPFPFQGKRREKPPWKRLFPTLGHGGKSQMRIPTFPRSNSSRFSPFFPAGPPGPGHPHQHLRRGPERLREFRERRRGRVFFHGAEQQQQPGAARGAQGAGSQPQGHRPGEPFPGFGEVG